MYVKLKKQKQKNVKQIFHCDYKITLRKTGNFDSVKIWRLRLKF